MTLTLRKLALLASSLLILLANASISAVSVYFWYEPECPEELLKK